MGAGAGKMLSSKPVARKLKAGRVANRMKLMYSYVRGEEISRGWPCLLAFEVTTKCNLSCPMCYKMAYDEQILPDQHMDFDVFTKLIDESYRYAELALLYGNGEPLMHPRIVDFVEYCAIHGIPSQMSTNATLLTEDLAEQLIRAGLDSIIFGVDGTTKEVFEKYRVGAEFEQVLENIHMFLDVKKRLNSDIFTVVQMIKLKDTAPQMEEFQRIWKGTPGVDAIRIKEDETKLPEVCTAINRKEPHERPRCVFPWQGPLGVVASGEVTHLGGLFTIMPRGDQGYYTINGVWNCREVQDIRRWHMQRNFEHLDVCLNCSRPKPMPALALGSFFFDTYHLRRMTHSFEKMYFFSKVPVLWT